jgi:hypothetical protein
MRHELPLQNIVVEPDGGDEAWVIMLERVDKLSPTSDDAPQHLGTDPPSQKNHPQ